MRAVLEARPLDGRMRLDLVRGAIDAHAHPRTPPTVPVVAGARRGPRLDRGRYGERPPAGRARLAGLPARDAATRVDRRDRRIVGGDGDRPPVGAGAARRDGPGTGARVRRSRPVGRSPRDRRARWPVRRDHWSGPVGGGHRDHRGRPRPMAGRRPAAGGRGAARGDGDCSSRPHSPGRSSARHGWGSPWRRSSGHCR